MRLGSFARTFKTRYKMRECHINFITHYHDGDVAIQVDSADENKSALIYISAEEIERIVEASKRGRDND